MMPKRPADIDHLSHSSISTYLRCPRQWAYSYLEGLRRPPGVALIKGSAVDKAASANLIQKIETRVDLPVEDVKEAAEDALRKEVDGAGGASEVQWSGESLPKAIDSAVSLTERHMMEHAPRIQPVTVQQFLSRPIPGTTRALFGHLDFIEEDGTVGDIKTGSRRMSTKDAENDQQATAYSYLMGRPIDFRFWRVIDTRRYVTDEIVSTQRSDTETRWYEEAAQQVSAAIDGGAYPPNPTGWWCDQKWCGFYSRCRIQNRPPEIG